MGLHVGMRRLWPPTYDRFTVRLWAAASSAAINLLLVALFFTRLESVFWWMLPGLIPAFAVGAMSGVPEGKFALVLGGAIFLIGNFGFYYLVSWVLINLFIPSTNWWPEKRT